LNDKDRTNGIPQDKLKVGDKVRVQLAKTQSPLWTVDEIIYDKERKERMFRLRTGDDTLHPELLDRKRLKLEN
jgi:hypothetical protein